MKFLILLALIPYCCFGKSVLIGGQLAHPADCTKHGEKLLIAPAPPLPVEHKLLVAPAAPLPVEHKLLIAPAPPLPAELIKTDFKGPVVVEKVIRETVPAPLEDPLKKKDEALPKPASPANSTNSTEKVTMTVTKVTRGAAAADKLEVVGKITPAMQELVSQTDAMLKPATLNKTAVPELSELNKTLPVEISKNVNKTAPATGDKPEPSFLENLASKLPFMSRKKRSTGEIDSSKLKAEKVSLTKDQFKASMLSDKAEAKASENRQERSYGGGFVRDFDDDFASTRSDFQYAVRTLPAVRSSGYGSVVRELPLETVEVVRELPEIRSSYGSSAVREFPEFDSSPAIRASRYRRSADPGYSSVRDFPEIRSSYGGSSFREAPLDFERSSSYGSAVRDFPEELRSSRYRRSADPGYSSFRDFPEIRSSYGGSSFREEPLDFERSSSYGSSVRDFPEELRSSRYRRSADPGYSSVRDFPEIRSSYGGSSFREAPLDLERSSSYQSVRDFPEEIRSSRYRRSADPGYSAVRDFPEIRSSYGGSSFREAPLDFERSSSYGSSVRDFPEEIRSSRYRRSADPGYGGSSVRELDLPEIRSSSYGSAVRDFPEIRSGGYGSSLVRDDSFERSSHGYGKSLGYGSPAIAVRELPLERSNSYGHGSVVRTLEEIPAVRVLDSEPLRSSGYGLQTVREIPAIRSEILEAPLLRSSYASKVPALRSSSSYGGSPVRDLDFDDDLLEVKSSGKYLNDFSDLRVSQEFPVVRSSSYDSSPIRVSSLDVEPLEVRGGGGY